MEKRLILITGSVMNSNPESVNTYNELVRIINPEKYEISSPLDTMQFKGTDEERYQRAVKMLSKTSLMIAEMSNVSTGQGMEIQQAAILGIPILVIAKNGSKVSGLVKGCPVVKKVVYYEDVKELENTIGNFIEEETNEKHCDNWRK